MASPLRKNLQNYFLRSNTDVMFRVARVQSIPCGFLIGIRATALADRVYKAEKSPPQIRLIYFKQGLSSRQALSGASNAVACRAVFRVQIVQRDLGMSSRLRDVTYSETWSIGRWMTYSIALIITSCVETRFLSYYIIS